MHDIRTGNVTYLGLRYVCHAKILLILHETIAAARRCEAPVAIRLQLLGLEQAHLGVLRPKETISACVCAQSTSILKSFEVA